MQKPEFLYKYRSIKNYDDLKNDHSIEALFNCYSIFSSRNNFNDLFDTKIAFRYPTPKEYKEIIDRLPKKDKKFMTKHTNKGKYTQEGRELLNSFRDQVNKIIDTYAIFSLTSKNDCNLLWAHYADSHNGFCIEFKSEKMQVDKIVYQEDIAELDFIDFLNFHFKLIPEIILGEKIKNLLIQKLNEWRYEDEYRVIASNELGNIKPGEKFTKVDYSEDFINSIIFGVRMEKKIKRFIIDNLPFNTQFKQAIEGKSKVEVIPFNHMTHM